MYYVVDVKSANIMCRHPTLTTHDAIRDLLVSHPSVMNSPEQSYTGMVQSAKTQPLATGEFKLSEALASTYVLGDLSHGVFRTCHSKSVPDILQKPNF